MVYPTGPCPATVRRCTGAESRQQIGWVIVGGMTFGTPLTLCVIPTRTVFLDNGIPLMADGASEVARSLPSEPFCKVRY